MYHYKYLVFLALCIAISACNQGTAPSTTMQKPQASAHVYLEPAALSLFAGQEFQLALHNAQGEELETQQAHWSSHNPAVASIQHGKIQAHQLGETQIEVSLKGIKQSMLVRVLPASRYTTSSIQGMLWHDANNNRHVDSHETVLANHEVFIDSNHNGRYDANEPRQQTDARGHYIFPYLAAGTYPVVSALPQGYRYADSAPRVPLSQPSQHSSGQYSQRSGQHSHKLSTSMVLADADWQSYRVYPEQGFDGVVSMRIRQANGAFRGCSGALLYGGYHILTAAHCLENWQEISSILFAHNIERRASAVYIHPQWSASDNRNDIAVIELEQSAPYQAERYDLYRHSDEISQYFIRVGYGATGSGNTGEDAAHDSKLRGYNRYDDSNSHFRRSMKDYQAPAGSQLAYDFDNGHKAQDAFGHYFNIHDVGVGKVEANAASGDSGSPAFIDGKIAGISSLSLAFANQVTDIDAVPLNSSFGEFAVDTRASYYQNWLDSVIQQSDHALKVSAWAQLSASRHTIVNFPLQPLK